MFDGVQDETYNDAIRPFYRFPAPIERLPQERVATNDLAKKHFKEFEIHVG
jgi:hypothetical protein